MKWRHLQCPLISKPFCLISSRSVLISSANASSPPKIKDRKPVVPSVFGFEAPHLLLHLCWKSGSQGPKFGAEEQRMRPAGEIAKATSKGMPNLLVDRRRQGLGLERHSTQNIDSRCRASWPCLSQWRLVIPCDDAPDVNVDWHGLVLLQREEGDAISHFGANARQTTCCCSFFSLPKKFQNVINCELSIKNRLSVWFISNSFRIHFHLTKRHSRWRISRRRSLQLSGLGSQECCKRAKHGTWSMARCTSTSLPCGSSVWKGSICRLARHISIWFPSDFYCFLSSLWGFKYIS